MSYPEPHEEIIFLPNDPATITSQHLHRDCDSAKRRPDVIAVFLSHLQERYEELQEKNWTAMAGEINRGKVKKLESGANRPPAKWIDIHQTWELKMDKNKKLEFSTRTWRKKDAPKADKLHLKRTREETNGSNDHPPSKKIGISGTKSSATMTGSRSRISSLILPPEDGSSTRLSHDVQCAYYAIERLSAAWHITHSTVILLEGKCLLIYYF